MLADGRLIFDPPLAAVRFVLQADPASVQLGLRQAMAVPPLSLLTDAARGDAQIVLAEVLNNVVEHAQDAPMTLASAAAGIRAGPKRAVQITLWLHLVQGQLHCWVEDGGLPMRGGIPEAGVLPDPQDLPEGGFGWHLIRSLCHGLSYRRWKNMNQLIFLIEAG
ncbi:ATP-binding protein [Xinfangfangia sp. CPCC 101601]|uniref:ATP-binding protein n=1 Tax=Pseudogemmobacter lacusdianii TaxID=3069608 RepID=A0ABU0VWZ7_9RHOB|nr:ATP-binding protein [Xinfangfangia sp. CPCC 101601]MDQ2066279.1 ATP-binding protein [Xinfangfangia sp. CPCC 101601]